MKKIFSVAFVLLLAAATMTAVSCGKDNGTTNTNNNVVNNGNNNNNQSGLAGTVWKYNYDDLHKKNEGGGLKFLSQTQVTVIDWEYDSSDSEYEEDVEESGTYEYTAPDGQLHLTSGDYNFFVEGNTLQLFNYDGYTQITMTRQ